LGSGVFRDGTQRDEHRLLSAEKVALRVGEDEPSPAGGGGVIGTVGVGEARFIVGNEVPDDLNPEDEESGSFRRQGGLAEMKVEVCPRLARGR
jgi:hypothetical protein